MGSGGGGDGNQARRSRSSEGMGLHLAPNLDSSLACPSGLHCLVRVDLEEGNC